MYMYVQFCASKDIHMATSIVPFARFGKAKSRHTHEDIDLEFSKKKSLRFVVEKGRKSEVESRAIKYPRSPFHPEHTPLLRVFEQHKKSSYTNESFRTHQPSSYVVPDEERHARLHVTFAVDILAWFCSVVDSADLDTKIERPFVVDAVVRKAPVIKLEIMVFMHDRESEAGKA
jgi:hypothetical protein